MEEFKDEVNLGESVVKALKGISNSMNIHPDCTEDSEFKGMVQRCDDILTKIDL